MAQLSVKASLHVALYKTIKIFPKHAVDIEKIRYILTVDVSLMSSFFKKKHHTYKTSEKQKKTRRSKISENNNKDNDKTRERITINKFNMKANFLIFRFINRVSV